MVTSPTLDFRGDLVVAVIAFFQGRSRACERTLAPQHRSTVHGKGGEKKFGRPASGTGAG